MQARESIRKNISWLVFANVISKPLWFLFLLLSARLLGPEEFGRYMLAISFILVANGILESGIDIHSIKTLPSDPGRFPKFFFHTMTLKLVGCLVAGVGAYLLGLAVPSLIPDDTLFLAAVVYGIGFVTMTHFRFIIRAFETMKYEAWSIFVEKISVILLCGISLVFFPTARGYGLLFAASYIVAATVTLWIVFRKIGTPIAAWDTRYAINEIIKPALPFAAMNVFIILYLRSGTLLLAMLTHSDQLVGFFNAGYRIVEAFVLFPSMIIAPLYPALARKVQGREEISQLIYDAMRIILILATVISTPIFLLRFELTPLLYGHQFQEAATTIGILSLVMIPVGLNWVVGTLVAVTGRQSRANFYILLITIGNIVMLTAMIPWLGVEGAAIATLVTECTITFANWTLVRDFVDSHHVKKLFARVAVPPLAISLVAFLVPHNSLYVDLPLIILGLVGSFYFLRLITVDDLSTVFRESASISVAK